VVPGSGTFNLAALRAAPAASAASPLGGFRCCVGLRPDCADGQSYRIRDISICADTGPCHCRGPTQPCHAQEKSEGEEAMKACLLALIWLTAAAASIARRDVVLQHNPSGAGAGL